MFSRRFKAIAEAAGLPPIRLHDVRHSFATASLAAGVPVKVLFGRIGHAPITTTLAIYGHVLPGDDETAAETTASAVLRSSGVAPGHGPEIRAVAGCVVEATPGIETDPA